MRSSRRPCRRRAWSGRRRSPAWAAHASAGGRAARTCGRARPSGTTGGSPGSSRPRSRGSGGRRRGPSGSVWASSRTAGGMVAERSNVWRGRGIDSRIASTAGWKPMSSIWSASSRTTILTRSRRIDCRSIRSIRRPGVAITIWQRWREQPLLAEDRLAADDADGKARRPSESLPNSRPIWWTSSRVGARIRAWGRRSFSSIFSRIGSEEGGGLAGARSGALPRQSRPAHRRRGSTAPGSGSALCSRRDRGLQHDFADTEGGGTPRRWRRGSLQSWSARRDSSNPPAVAARLGRDTDFGVSQSRTRFHVGQCRATWGSATVAPVAMRESPNDQRGGMREKTASSRWEHTGENDRVR